MLVNGNYESFKDQNQIQFLKRPVNSYTSKGGHISSLLIEFPLQTNMNMNNKEKDNSLLRFTNRKRENTYNTPFIQKSEGI